MTIFTLGIDLAKSVFQLHGVGADGTVLLQKRVRRSSLLPTLASLPPCLVGIEACPTAYYWAREISLLGHEVRLIPPAYVKPYVKRQKNDAADAEAICEAVTRPNMRFVPIRSEARQAVMALHRSRDLLMRQRTMLLNAARAQLAEFGIVLPLGPRNTLSALQRLDEDEAMSRLPELLRAILKVFAAQLESLGQGIRALERKLIAWHRSDPTSQRLETIPGVGILTATAFAASIENPAAFQSGRDLAAFLGLVPRQNSTGGKPRLGSISRMGNGYLRRLLVVGATSVVRRAAGNETATGPWLRGLLARKPTRLVTVAVANKTARIAWALMARGGTYQAHPGA